MNREIENKQTAIAKTIIESEQVHKDIPFPTGFTVKLRSLIKNKKIYAGGLALVSASFIGNILNFLYNSYLGRVLRFEDFALIGLISGLLSFASIFFGAFSTTANYRSAFLIGKYGNEAGYMFWKYIRKRVMIMSLLVAIGWILFTPLLMKFFDAQTPMLFILFSLVLLTGFANGADRGYISAKFQFGSLAVINLFDPIVRLLVAIVFVYVGLKFWTFSAIPIAIFGTFVIGWVLVIIRKNRKSNGETSVSAKEIRYFPYKFFVAALLTGFSSIAFSTFDILLANHYLSSVEAGKYTLLSLVGKMVYFLGGLTTPFVIPLISRIEGANKKSKSTMYVLLFSTAFLAFIGFLGFGVLGFFSIPFLYGKKAFSIISFLQIYTLGMLCYTTSKVFVNYYLVRKVYTFTIATSLLVLVQLALIALYHANAGSVGIAMAVVWILHLVVTTSLHLAAKKVIAFENTIYQRFGLRKKQSAI